MGGCSPELSTSPRITGARSATCRPHSAPHHRSWVEPLSQGLKPNLSCLLPICAGFVDRGASLSLAAPGQILTSRAFEVKVDGLPGSGPAGCYLLLSLDCRAAGGEGGAFLPHTLLFPLSPQLPLHPLPRSDATIVPHAPACVLPWRSKPAGPGSRPWLTPLLCFLYQRAPSPACPFEHPPAVWWLSPSHPCLSHCLLTPPAACRSGHPSVWPPVFLLGAPFHPLPAEASPGCQVGLQARKTRMAEDLGSVRRPFQSLLRDVTQPRCSTYRPLPVEPIS